MTILRSTSVNRCHALQQMRNHKPASTTTSITMPLDDLKVLSFNARSLRNKFDELRCLTLTENVDIIAITETFIDIKKII